MMMSSLLKADKIMISLTPSKKPNCKLFLLHTVASHFSHWDWSFQPVHFYGNIYDFILYDGKLKYASSVI